MPSKTLKDLMENPPEQFLTHPSDQKSSPEKQLDNKEDINNVLLDESLTVDCTHITETSDAVSDSLTESDSSPKTDTSHSLSQTEPWHSSESLNIFLISSENSTEFKPSEEEETALKRKETENILESSVSEGKAGTLRTCPSMDAMNVSVSPGVKSNTDSGIMMVEEAWERLRKSFVYFKGKPVGTLAAMDICAETLNYNQV